MRKLINIAIVAALAACSSPHSEPSHIKVGEVLTPLGGGTSATANGGLVCDGTGCRIDPTGASTTARIAYNGTKPIWRNELWWQSSAADCWWDELDGSSTSSSHLNESNISTPSFVSTGSDTHPSVWSCSTAALATAGCQFHTINVGHALSATDITTIKWIASIRTLDDGTDTFAVELGAGDANNLTSVDGFGFLYAKTTAVMGSATTAKWQIWESAGSLRRFATLDGVTADTVDSTVAVGDMSNNTGQINSYMISGTTSRLDFCINDTDPDGYCHAGSTGHVGSACASGCSMSNDRIPGAGTANTWGVQALIGKQAGTTVARFLDVDGGGYCRPFSAAR